MIDTDKAVFGDISLKTSYYNRKPSKSHMSGRDTYIQSNLDDDVSKILNLDNKIGAEELKTRSYNLTLLISILDLKSY